MTAGTLDSSRGGGIVLLGLAQVEMLVKGEKGETMPLSLDPEIAAALQKTMGDAPPPKAPPAGEVAGRRAMFESWMRLVSSMLPKVTDVSTHDFATKSPDGTSVKLRWYEKDGGTKGP